MTEERMKVIVMGRRLGTASGWDLVDDQTECFYGFEPSVKELRPGTFQVSHETGVGSVVSDEGDTLFTVDMITILMLYPNEVVSD